MSKVICDVCGTSYPETVSQCPICGCVRSADTKVIAGVDEETIKDNGTYTYVKGGRFSKSNVNKRNKARHTAPEAPVSETRQEKRERMTQKRNAQSNKGLVVAVLALLLAIVAVVIYIVLRFFAPFSGTESALNNGGIVNEEIPGDTGDVVVDVPCTSIALSETEINFGSADISILLNVTCTPENTTDEVTFASDDPAVATVDAEGKITAVAEGETVVRVTCGSATAECKVICSFAPAGEPSDETPAETPDETPDVPSSEPPATTEAVSGGTELSFNTAYPNEMSLIKGTTFRLCLQDSSKKAVDAEFTSGNTSVCTVDEDGTVKGVGKGTTVIRAVYEGNTYKCTVHVK